MNTERQTIHADDGTKQFLHIETLTVEGGKELKTVNSVQRYQYDNHLGSACLELSSSAAIISYEEYHPFGTTSYKSGVSEAEVSLKRYKYVGKERDEETGLYYYGARYYAAWLSRFVSVDPLQHKYPYYTPYQYAGNKPISYIDLDGKEPAISDANYGQNIFFGWEEHYAGIHPTERDSSNVNWIASAPKTLDDINTFLTNIKETVSEKQNTKLTIKNLVIVAHGVEFPDNTSGIIVTPGLSQSFTRSISGIDINADVINSYLNMQKIGFEKIFESDPKAKEWYNSTGIYVEKLQKIMNQVEKGGNIIFTSCGLGKDEEMMKALFLLSGERLNIIANKNETKIGGTNDALKVLDVSFKNAPKDEGWVIIGPKTNGVQKVGGENNQIKLTKNEEPVKIE